MIRWMYSVYEISTTGTTGGNFWMVGGGSFMSAHDWMSYKCRQLLRLLTDNYNSTQLYQKGSSSPEEPSLLRQVTFRCWTAPVLDTDPVLGVDSDPGPGGGAAGPGAKRRLS